LARYPALAEFISRECGAKGRLKLLDVGCGAGKLMRCGEFSRVQFAGLDIRLSSLKVAREYGYRWLVQANVATCLPFATAAFDVVVCNHLLEHLTNPELVLAEAKRVLQPKGLLLVGVPISWTWIRWLRMHLLPLLNPRKSPEALAADFGHVSFFTLPSIKALLDGAGFEVEDVRGFRFFSSRHLPFENWRWYYHLNCWWGRRFPRLTSEVNLVARKRLTAV